jgi:hypothetical protein
VRRRSSGGARLVPRPRGGRPAVTPARRWRSDCGAEVRSSACRPCRSLRGAPR